MKQTLQDMGLNVTLHLHVDSTACEAIIDRVGLGRLRHVDIRHLFLQQMREGGKLFVHRVPGDRNPAAAMT